MSRIIEIPKDERGKTIIDNRYEILQFSGNGLQGGQSHIGFSLDHNAGKRLITQKFYGIKAKIKETQESTLFLVAGREYALRTMQHEIDMLRPLEAIFPHVPMLLTTGEYLDVPFSNLTNGRESQAIPQEVDNGHFNIRDYNEGRILSIEDIIKAGKHPERREERLNEIRNWSIEKKVSMFIGFMDTINTVHKDYGIINKDIKPQHLLILSPRFSEEPRPQIIDWASSIQKDHLDSMKDFLIGPTTAAYNHPAILKTHKRILRGDMPDDIIAEIKKEGSLSGWDQWSMGICGMEFLLGRSPYMNTAMSLIAADPAISRNERLLGLMYEKFMAKGTVDPDDESMMVLLRKQIDDEKTSCIIKAQERYLEERRRPGYYIRRKDQRIPEGIERILHSMLDVDSAQTLDGAIDALKAYTYPAGKRIARRVFCKEGLAAIAGAACTGVIIYNGLMSADSPNRLNESLMNNARSQGRIDKDDLAHLTKRIIEEQWTETLTTTMDMIRKKGEISIPSKVENGRYQLDECSVLEAGYFPRMLLLSGLMLGREDLIEDYKFLIGKMQFFPGEGYRIFRIMDPLEEFMKVSSRINAKDELVQKADDVLKRCREYIMQEHLVNDDGVTYFKAYTKDIPVRGFKHVIRPAYHIVKHMSDHAPLEYGRHMEALERFLIRDGLTYDTVSFNDETDRRPGVLNVLKGTYDKIDPCFYANSCEQVLMIDLFSDYFIKTGKGKKTLDTLWNRYRNNIMRFGPSIEFLDAPENIRSFNNSPFIVNTCTLTEKQQLFGSKDTCEFLLMMHGLMDFSQRQGIIPSARYETHSEYSRTFRITSDYLALRSDLNFIG